MKFPIYLSALVLASVATVSDAMSIRSSSVQLDFDPERGQVSQIEVKGRADRFEQISSSARIIVRTDMPDQEPRELTLGQLVQQEVDETSGVYRFEYRIVEEPQWKLIQTFKLEGEALTWHIQIENPTSNLVGLNIDVCFSDLYVHTRKAFNTNKLNPDGYPKLKYRADYIGEFPMTSILDEQRDLGLTINSTFGVMRPLFWIEYDKNAPEQSVMFRNQYLGAGDGIVAQVSMDLFGHVGDWRPGMGKIFEHYKPYFTTSNAAIRKHEGNFLCAWYFVSVKGQDYSPWDSLMVRNVEIIFYNPYYGLYAPNVSDDTPWTILMLERETYEQFKDDPTRQTTYREINESIDRMREVGVGSFMYFNYIDASRAMPELRERFADQIFVNADERMGRGRVGEESRGNDNLSIMHMEPGQPWGNYMVDQAKALLARVPNCDGYFIDMASGYGVYDRNHSDGVTVIKGKKAYYDAIGIARMQEHLKTTVWEPAGKGVWANGPKFPEISRYCDAAIAEIPGWTFPERDPGVSQISFLCLDKPVVYMLAAWRKDNDPPKPTDIERHFKHALLYGAFIDTMIPMKSPGKERERAFASYRPLFEALVGKRWVFSPRPVTIPTPFFGNIFTYESGDYTVYVLDRESSLLNPPETIHRDVKIEINVPDAQKLTRATYVCVTNPDQKVDLPIQREGNKVVVTLPEFGVAGMVRFQQ